MPGGRVTVAPRAIAAIVADAALNCDGVAGLSDSPDSAAMLPPDDARRGIDIHIHDNDLMVDIYLLVRAGAPIADVAHAVQQQVRAALALALDAANPRVNVRVQGVRD